MLLLAEKDNLPKPSESGPSHDVPNSGFVDDAGNLCTNSLHLVQRLCLGVHT